VPKVTEAHLEARREQILKAAVCCFARNGYHATTMQDVCREAELSPGAVYRYFTGKHEILEAVFEQSMEDNVQMFSMLEQVEDPREALENMMEFGFRLLDDPAQHQDMRLGLILYGESLRDERMAKAYRRLFRRIVDHLQAAVEKAQRLGAVDPSIDARSYTRLMMALFEGFRLQKLLDPEVDTDGFIAAMKAITLTPPPPRS
jgi:AcrR family transcriptional regulator